MMNWFRQTKLPVGRVKGAAVAMKKWLKTYLGFNQNVLAWVGVLLAAATLFFVLFAYPRVGAADFGEYDLKLYRLGLSRMAADEADVENRYFTRVIEAYQVDGVDEQRLFGTIPTESMVYPVALISSVCGLFHIPFDTVYLAILYCVLVLISVFVLTKALYGYMGNRALAFPVLLCLCVLNSDNVVPFNSLYSDGFVLTSLLFFVAMAVRALVAEHSHGIRNIVPVFIGAWLFLTSNDSMIYLTGIVLAFLIYVCVKNRTDRSKIVYYLCVAVGGCLLITLGSIHFAGQNESLHTSMNLHSATFNGAFVQADNKTEALAYFELEEELQADIGKSYYLQENEYVVAPYSEEAETRIYSHITYPKLFAYYASHPEVFWRVLNQNLAVTARADLERYLYIDSDGSSNANVEVEKLGYYAFLRRLIVPLNMGTLLLFFALALVAITAVWFYRWRKKERRSICAVLVMLLFLCMGRLFVTTFLYGTFENSFQLFSYMMFVDICLVSAVCVMLQTAYVLVAYLNEKVIVKEPEMAYVVSTDGPVAYLGRKIRLAVRWCDTHILSKQKYAVIALSVLAAFVMFVVLFVPERIGAYNNGDFGRMMDAMGLYYTDYDLLHQDEQYVTKVIETYVWLDTFDWTSVTFLNPTMSQVFLAVLVKMTAGAMGFEYSTVYATVIYWIMMCFGFSGIVYGLYKSFGKKSLLLSGMLIVVLFGSYNLGWFNSLFSEATEMACFLLVLGISLCLIVKERGSVRWYEWLALMISIRLFVGSKSQVTPEIMVLGIWAVILAVYHRKRVAQAVEENAKQKLRRNVQYAMQILLVTVMVVLTARSAVIIFQKDSEISSQDTTYSSIFSGVLMVADDPVEALGELGLDESLVADVGKNPYLGEGAYYCQPRTEMAEEMIYSKVNTFNVLGWYLKHPQKLLQMLDHAAQESAARMPDYFLYVGEKTTQEHRTVSKFNIWSAMRGSLTPNHFWQYFVLYGAIILMSLRYVFKKEVPDKLRLMAGFMIVVVFAGAIQFPLSVIGNGFIDNTKQLFMFRLIHDMIMTATAFYVLIHARRQLARLTRKISTKDEMQK